MNSTKLEQAFLFLLLGGAFILALLIFWPFLGSLALAAVVAAIVRPVHLFFLRHLRGWRGLAAFMTVVVSVICILIPVAFLGTQIAKEAQQLYSSLVAEDGSAYLARALEAVEKTAGQYFPIAEFSASATADIDAYLKQGLAWIIWHLGAAFSSIASLVLNFLIFFIALYYLLRDGPEFKRHILALSPLPDSYDETVFSRLELAVDSVFKGNFAIALIQGVLTAIGFSIFGVPNAVLWGAAAALAALIPGFGTALVIIPGIVFLFLEGSSAQAVGLIIWGAFAVGLIDNFLGPKLVGRGMKMHPLLVLLAVLGGIIFYGPLGIFLGPLTLSFLFALISIHFESARPRPGSATA